MSTTDRDPSVGDPADHDPDDPISTTHYSLSRAVHARRSEYTRSRTIRIKIGTWNAAACPGTDKDLASWFVDGEGVEPGLTSNLASLKLSEDSIDCSSDTDPIQIVHEPQSSHAKESTNSRGDDDEAQGPNVKVLGGDKIGLYVLGLQEIISLNLVQKSLYSDPSSVAKWQDALEAALPRGYRLVASQQMVGLLLLIYASPEIAPTISNESTVSIGTGLLYYMGNKGAVVSRIVLGETTSLVFSNCHLASGQDQGSLDRRCWDYNKIITQTKFAPIVNHGVEEEEGNKIGEEDFCFFFGDLNFRLDGLPGNDIRHLLTLHARGEYDLSKKDGNSHLGEEGVIIIHNKDDDDSSGASTPGMISRETSFDTEEDEANVELPDPDDFVPDPHDDPASLQATLDSLLPHDQLRQVINSRKAFHEGWREGPITFLPTYKYDVGTVGLFDSSEKKRAPSWCDRILWRTRKDYREYSTKYKDEIDAKKRDDEMKQSGVEQAANDESVLFDYDPTTDSSTETLTAADTAYEIDDYNEDDDAGAADDATIHGGPVDKINLDLYTSHQRIMSSDHKPLVAMFTLTYDAVVPELKAKVHAEVAKELDRVENEARPEVTIVFDSKETNANKKDAPDAAEGINFGEVGFMRRKAQHMTIANTGRVLATITLSGRPNSLEHNGQKSKWLEFEFVNDLDDRDEAKEQPLSSTISLEPGETVNAIIRTEVRDLVLLRALNEENAKLEDILVLSVENGRDYFMSIRATWRPSCFGRSIEELVRIPRGGITAFMTQRQAKGSIPYSLEAQSSSPTELFKLTDAIHSLTERVIADENMIEDMHVPREKAGWPFSTQASQTRKDDDFESLLGSIVEALEDDKPILDTLKADVPALKRLEIVSEVLLLFVQSMTDGIVSAPLWAQIEQTVPQLGSEKTLTELEDVKSRVFDILASAPYHNISFVFLTTMLDKVASELLPLNKDELEAVGTRNGSTRVGKRSLSFRRNNVGATVDETAIQRRLAWERQVAEVFGPAVCRTAPPANVKEKKAVEDKMKGLLEIFIRRGSKT